MIGMSCGWCLAWLTLAALTLGCSTPSANLDPQHPTQTSGIAGDPWRRFGSVAYIPAAGCYSLDATWPGGGWHVVFAAGRG